MCGLNTIAEKKLATIESQIQEVETTKKLYQNSSDVMSKRVSLLSQMKKTAASSFHAENVKPDIGADMIFVAPTGSGSVLGQVLQCHAIGEGLKKLSVSQSSTVIVYCHNTDGVPYTNSESL